MSGTPGPVFVECPVDLLYPESIVREWYAAKTDKPAKTLADRALKWYIKRHLNGMFDGAAKMSVPTLLAPATPIPSQNDIDRAWGRLSSAARPVLVLGSQAVLQPSLVGELIDAMERLEVPVFLSGMARGLLSLDRPYVFRHKRKEALKQADFVLLAGVPADFRLDYGAHVNRKGYVVGVNRSRRDLFLNRKPNLAALADPASFLIQLSKRTTDNRPNRKTWLDELREREAKREQEITTQALEQPTSGLNPVAFFQAMDEVLDDNSVLVADGGDFVATASYILRPRKPLRWLDPGVFGTLGVGGGFALGAKTVLSDSEVWIIYGDGSSGYSLAEIDTCVRHGLPVIAVIGNDACWSQIARDQIEILGDGVGTELSRTAYHTVAEGYGGVGLLLSDPGQTRETLIEAKRLARSGKPVVINVILSSSDFRKGSLSM